MGRKYRYTRRWITPLVGANYVPLAPADPSRWMMQVCPVVANVTTIRPKSLPNAQTSVLASGLEGIRLNGDAPFLLTYQDYGDLIGYDWEASTDFLSGPIFLIEGFCD